MSGVSNCGIWRASSSLKEHTRNDPCPPPPSVAIRRNVKQQFLQPRELHRRLYRQQRWCAHHHRNLRRRRVVQCRRTDGPGLHHVQEISRDLFLEHAGIRVGDCSVFAGFLAQILQRDIRLCPVVAHSAIDCRMVGYGHWPVHGPLLAAALGPSRYPNSTSGVGVDRDGCLPPACSDDRFDIPRQLFAIASIRQRVQRHGEDSIDRVLCPGNHHFESLYLGDQPDVKTQPGERQPEDHLQPVCRQHGVYLDGHRTDRY